MVSSSSSSSLPSSSPPSSSRPSKRPRNNEQKPSSSTQHDYLPILDVSSPDFSLGNFLDLYSRNKIVHLKNIKTINTKFSWKDVGTLFHELNQDDKDSWCIETAGIKEASTSDDGRHNNDSPSTTSLQLFNPREFLQPIHPLLTSPTTAAYCSFLVQKDKVKLEETLSKLPVSELFLGGITWSHEPCLWIFFGRNSTNDIKLQGRPEHTDSVSHDGTWHYQLSGTKEWVVRPTKQLLHEKQQQLLQEQKNEDQIWTEESKFSIICTEGDVLVINTRLWFHQTFIIPNQKTSPSVSYARDFWMSAARNVSTNKESTKEGTTSMSNVDGLYAADDIEEGTILFTENDMPDCELHRSSTNPNCVVVELEDGTSAVVSSRAILSGEFFCIPESDDEDEQAEELDDDEEDDGGDINEEELEIENSEEEQ